MQTDNEKIISNNESDSQAPKQNSNFFSRFNFNSSIIKIGLTILIISGLIFGSYYWHITSQQIYTDKAEIYAPLIILSPSQPSTLRKIMVKNGDMVIANQTLAILEDGQYIHAKTDGMVVNINDQIGKLFSPGTAIITMINPADLRLIAHVAENKGLNDIRVGQKVVFTVDTFDNKKFNGEVEEISQSSDQSSVVFSISDKRDEKYFSIKIKYDGYPQLLNGMSAKAWILK